MMKITNTYLTLGDAFFERSAPTPVETPRLLFWNDPLAAELLIPLDLQHDAGARAQVFSGNRMLPGFEPVALAYAGHQFGGFVPQLGDGRAHLLADVEGASGRRYDIQLKGSGPTRFSRRGDGRCALGPAVREFIMSEAMAALNIPTTRSLAVVSTGEEVWREDVRDGAVVTRVAASHLRVGTFEYFAARGDVASLAKLLDYAIERHYPEISLTDPDKHAAFIKAVIARQVHLVTEWMRVGFIHGVMNTDNTTISGETIDYGPCAMMNAYDPEAVYSSIDVRGRYAFGRQPQIAQWNMAKLAESLLPLFPDNQEEVAARFSELITSFSEQFVASWSHMIGNKLGLAAVKAEDHDLVNELLTLMAEHKLDYTQTFAALTKAAGDECVQAPSALSGWIPRWRIRLSAQNRSLGETIAVMALSNPVVIARNHHVEAVLAACEAGDTKPAEDFLAVLRHPYQESEAARRYQDAPSSEEDQNYQTFCGT